MKQSGLQGDGLTAPGDPGRRGSGCTGRPASAAGAPRLARPHASAPASARSSLGFGRMTYSETEGPNMVVNLVGSGCAVVQSDNVTEP